VTGSSHCSLMYIPPDSAKVLVFRADNSFSTNGDFGTSVGINALSNQLKTGISRDSE
jgi:hypothetical protein